MTENGLNLNDRIVQNRVIQQHQQDRGQDRVLAEHRVLQERERATTTTNLHGPITIQQSGHILPLESKTVMTSGGV